MLRAAYVFAAVGAITLVLLPFQAIAVWLDLPLCRRIPMRFHRTVCAILGLRVHERGRRLHDHPAPDRRQPLLVARHLGDRRGRAGGVRGQAGGRPLAVIGLLARLQRTVFVDRARRHKTRDVNAEIAERLARGDPVVLFGEGTSSDGNRVLAFRSALIGSARDALADAERTGRVWIQPLSLAYTHAAGLPLCRRDRPRVAWYGNMSMAPHLAALARRGGVDVSVMWGEPVAFDEQSDRKQVARALEAQVRRRTILTLRGRNP